MYKCVVAIITVNSLVSVEMCDGDFTEAMNLLNGWYDEREALRDAVARHKRRMAKGQKGQKGKDRASEPEPWTWCFYCV